MNDENRTDTKADFDRMIGELTNISNLDQTTLSEQTIVDLAAYYGAIELLMPREWLRYLQDILEISDIKTIAEFFRVPRWVVEQAFLPAIRIHFES